MSTKHFLATLVLGIGAVACDPSAGPAQPRPATPAEAKAIQDLVFTAQRDGFIKQDFDAYMRQWGKDARIVSGRGPEPGPYDFALTRPQIEATKRMRFVGVVQPIVIDFIDTQITLSGDEATMRTTAVYKSTDEQASGAERIGEIYRLRRAADGWRVFENRHWLISLPAGDTIETYDARFYAAADAAVDQARAGGDTRDLSLALMKAQRWPEAHGVLVALTQSDEAETTDWHLRADAAMMIGDAEDAKAAQAAIRRLEANGGEP